MKIAIVGNGYVGQGLQRLFPDAFIIDPPKEMGLENITAKGFGLAIVCVPTPQGPDGSCDTSFIDHVVPGLQADLILIKSTVPPGTTERLRQKFNQRLVFSPEYLGESKYWTPPQFPSPTDSLGHGFVILGGYPSDCSMVADILLPILGPATRFRFMTPTEAELVKYFENAFFAMKVTFANEVRRISELAGANYHTVREGWLDDPRVGPMHTAAFKQKPGFDGKCLPKDIAALAAFCRSRGWRSELLETIIEVNTTNANL